MDRTFSVSQLGRMGRFGNAVFQYMFAKTYARRFDLQVECPTWIGNFLFDASDLPLTHRFRVFREKDSHGRDDALIPNRVRSLIHRDIQGFFQYHTGYYAPEQEFLRTAFQFAPRLRGRLAAGWERIAVRGKTAVGIHLRRGDYGYGVFYRTPIEWYLRWLEEIWPQLDEPFLYVATDDLPLANAAFAKYKPAMIDAFCVRIAHRKLDFVRDWYALTRCHYLAMPNSTFSFSAALFGQQGVQCFRSSLPDRGFIQIDPWNEQPILTGPEAQAENFPEIPGLIIPRQTSGKKRPLRSMMRRLHLTRQSFRGLTLRMARPLAAAWPR
ncbi:MAG TPA: hypothetical protein VHY91_05165 [Pirellulales bacterium]|nr:hypothetical protein [Pirellulales bacterium]